MKKPWHQTDGYTFKIPPLDSETATKFLVRFADALIDLTPAERVDRIDAWLPAIRNPEHAAKNGISATDQHLVVTELLTWREDNKERM